MFKKLFYCSLLLTTATAVSAAHYKTDTRYNKNHGHYKGELQPLPPKSPSLMDFIPCQTFNITPGPYIGINPGLRTNYNQTSSVYKAFEGTVFAGYALLSTNFYLAGEIFAQHGAELQNYAHNLNNNLNPVGVKTTWGTGLSILPGVLIADTLLGYLRLGGVLTHFQDAGESSGGGQVGVGLQGSVTESLDMRAEYIYSFYHSMTSIGSPRSDQFRVGILYRIWT